MIVYRITNRANGKMYFGITRCSLAKRWREHKCAAKAGKDTLFCDAIRKYGTAGFRVEVVYEAATEIELLAVERGLIAQYGTTNRKIGYNLTGGGQSVHAPHAKRAAAKLLTDDVVRFIRNPALAQVVNRELVDMVRQRFGKQIARDTIRDSRRGDSSRHMDKECPPIKCNQGGRASALRSSCQAGPSALRAYWSDPVHRQEQSVRRKGKPRVRRCNA